MPGTMWWTIISTRSKKTLPREEHVDCAIDYLMIAKYLERLGDHAVNICEWVQFYKTGMHKSERIL